MAARLHPIIELSLLSSVGAASSIIFVATKVSGNTFLFLSRQIFCPHGVLSQQAYFRHSKRRVLLQQTCVCRDKTFVATKMILHRESNSTMKYNLTKFGTVLLHGQSDNHEVLPVGGDEMGQWEEGGGCHRCG